MPMPPESAPRAPDPLEAVVLRMEAILREIAGRAEEFIASDGCGCDFCATSRLIARARALLRDLDAVRGETIETP